jgi:Acyl-coenzyme A synthetases/AMP-(fatty) acid ligases
VPDEIHQVPGIPRTLSGKKLEVPVRKILHGTDPERAADPNALADPDVLRYFGRFQGAGESAVHLSYTRTATSQWGGIAGPPG